MPKVDKQHHVFIMVVSEDSTSVLLIAKDKAQRIKSLLKAQQDGGEWPDKVNALLDEGTEISVLGTISTMGDGWGWF